MKNKTNWYNASVIGYIRRNSRISKSIAKQAKEELVGWFSRPVIGETIDIVQRVNDPLFEYVVYLTHSILKTSLGLEVFNSKKEAIKFAKGFSIQLARLRGEYYYKGNKKEIEKDIKYASKFRTKGER